MLLIMKNLKNTRLRLTIPKNVNTDKKPSKTTSKEKQNATKIEDANNLCTDCNLPSTSKEKESVF